MATIVLINPRFEVSYWGFQHALPILGKKANMPPACLPLLAAITPPEHEIVLIDENVEELDFDRIASADIVGVTGMSVQRTRMREILGELKARGAFTVVGGAWVSVHENYFNGLVDVIFIGEAEQTWPQFLLDWEHDSHAARYEQATRTDLALLPTPRFERMKMREYVFGSVQFSRGCPFRCEFCDIIVTFGRRPRLKTSTQILSELDALRSQGMRMVFSVDDNFVGNKRAIRPILYDLIAWQSANGYAMAFFTEASLDLAEDTDLMRLMTEANITSVFVGIESPNSQSLLETRKTQNIHKNRSMLERVHAIQKAGMEVWCGMILGFDHDDSSVFAAHETFLKEARIVHAMLGMLYAIPKTPLYTRLSGEGRLDPLDGSPFGTNVIPKMINREELREGYVRLLNDLYDPVAYFSRASSLYLSREFRLGGARERWRAQHPWVKRTRQVGSALRATLMYWRLMSHVRDKDLRQAYREQIFRIFSTRFDLSLISLYLIRCAMHYHCCTMARQMTGQQGRIVNVF
jgi:radical SAM superfamily enzyme YgiQ (UPF0313 family)